MQLPAGYRIQTGGGTDSHIGSMVGAHGAYFFDRGWYASPLVVDGDGRRLGTTPCQVSIDGHPVRLVQEARGDTAIWVGAAWIDLQGGRNEPKSSITISGRGRDSAWAHEALAAIASVDIAR